jgi:DNA-directed RNA polymerase subunit N (RpoN/RPB10)
MEQDTTAGNTLGCLLENVLEICPLHAQNFFLVKSKISRFGTTVLKCPITRISIFLDFGLKEFCCICIILSRVDLAYTASYILGTRSSFSMSML